MLVAKRLLTGLVTVIVIILLSGTLIHLVPGDPVIAMLGQGVMISEEDLANLRTQLGLDLPVWHQVLNYLFAVLRGDLGTSFRGNEPVATLLFDRLPNTFVLAVTGLAIALLIGVPLGFIAAIRRGTAVDTGVMLVAVVGVSIPGFWLALILLQIFSVELRWFPVAGTDVRSMVLPSLALGLSYSALVARMTRSALIDILAEDYIRTARARGLRERDVLLVHAFRPALISIVTVVALVFAYLMGGQVIVENVFSWNGIGRLAIQAMLQRDYPMIQGFIVVFATTIVIVSMSLDIVYGILDPRVRKQ